MRMNRIATNWDIEGLMKADDNPDDEYRAYLDCMKGWEDENPLTLQEFREYIESLSE